MTLRTIWLTGALLVSALTQVGYSQTWRLDFDAGLNDSNKKLHGELKAYARIIPSSVFSLRAVEIPGGTGTSNTPALIEEIPAVAKGEAELKLSHAETPTSIETEEKHRTEVTRWMANLLLFGTSEAMGKTDTDRSEVWDVTGVPGQEANVFLTYNASGDPDANWFAEYSVKLRRTPPVGVAVEIPVLTVTSRAPENWYEISKSGGNVTTKLFDEDSPVAIRHAIKVLPGDQILISSIHTLQDKSGLGAAVFEGVVLPWANSKVNVSTSLDLVP